MKARKNDAGDRSGMGCNVNSTFNFTIGAFAVLAAAAISYFVYHWMK
jgi:hypothetical protein